MSFDIYGNKLRPGCCEVHPFINETYPCSECVAESVRLSRIQRDESEYWVKEEKKYYEQMRREIVEDLENIDGDGI